MELSLRVNFFRCARTRAHFALMTTKSSAVGMRNAILKNRSGSAGYISNIMTRNRPRSICKNSNIAPTLSGQTSIFGFINWADVNWPPNQIILKYSPPTQHQFLQKLTPVILYLVLFSLYPSLLWESREKKKKHEKNLQCWPESLGDMLEYWYIERGYWNYKVIAMVTFLPEISRYYKQTKSPRL